MIPGYDSLTFRVIGIDGNVVLKKLLKHLIISQIVRNFATLLSQKVHNFSTNRLIQWSLLCA